MSDSALNRIIVFIQKLGPLVLFILVGKGTLTLCQLSLLLGEERRYLIDYALNVETWECISEGKAVMMVAILLMM